MLPTLKVHRRRESLLGFKNLMNSSENKAAALNMKTDPQR